VPGADQADAFDAFSLAGELQGTLLMSYMEAVCQAAGVSTANVVRAQYFLSDIRDFAGIAETARAEEISIEGFVALARALGESPAAAG